MPFIRIALAGVCPPAKQIARLQRQTTDLIARLLGKRPEVTVVGVEATPATDWGYDGEYQAARQQTSQVPL